MERKYRLSQLSVIKEVAGTYMLMYVFSDLTDSDLQNQFIYYLEREDYEYCDAIKAEAASRNIKLKVKK